MHCIYDYVIKAIGSRENLIQLNTWLSDGHFKNILENTDISNSTFERCKDSNEYYMEMIGSSCRSIASTGVTIEEASKLLNLKIEVIGNKVGDTLTEHLIVDSGEVLLNQVGKLYDENITEIDDWQYDALINQLNQFTI